LSLISRRGWIPSFCERSERSPDEAGHGLRFRVGEYLGVGEAGVVVDDRVHDVVAEPAAAWLTSSCGRR
jgi:hypothetical protein